MPGGTGRSLCYLHHIVLIFPAEPFAVLSDRTDFDADTAGRDEPFRQCLRPRCTGFLVGQSRGIVLAIQCMYRAGLHAPLAPDAERFFQHRIRPDLCRGKDGRKPDPGPELRGQEHVVDTEIPETGKQCGMTVREEGNRTLQKDADGAVTVPGNPDRGIAFSRKSGSDPVPCLVQQGVDRPVEPWYQMDGADSRTGRETGRPITITVFVSGKMARGRKASGTQGSNRGSSQRPAGANPTSGISSPAHFFWTCRRIASLMEEHTPGSNK